MAEFDELRAKIKVIGVGGAGGNTINDMVDSGIVGVEFAVANTDAQDLKKSKASIKVQLGDKLTKGLGAGANPEIGKLAAEEDKAKIVAVLENTDMLFITAGMGGGTGTGASPVIAEVAREMGILTIAIVTKPFGFEGPKRKRNADIGIEKLREYVDAIVIIPNDKLRELPERKITLQNAFKAANDVLRIAVQGMSEVITRSGYVSLDFADINAVMKDSGIAMLGFGEAEGVDRVTIATEKALNNPLLEKPISGAYKVLVNITAGPDFTLEEASEIAENIIKTSGNEDLDVMYGIVIDEHMENFLRVTVIATDFENKKVDPLHKPEQREALFLEEGSDFRVRSSFDSDSDDDGLDVGVIDVPAFLRKKR
ncbi:MAG: cell division protein FtsZ [Fusobacteria bacterium]|nr:cell division protein FtsZ [Fusobacteriota bacterium]